MKTKCMSCGGPTKKMQNGGPTKKMQNGGLTTSAKKVLKQGPIKTIKTIRKAVNKITKPTTPKMELGGTLETFQNGGGKKGRGWKIGMDPLLHEKQRCNYKKKKKLSQLNARDKAVRILKGVGKTVLGAGAAIGAGAIAYKKSPRFKNALDQFKTDVKDKLGLQKGGVVKKYQDGGPIDSLKVIKKKGKLAVKTEKQKQAAAKKAAANAKKIAKAKENARLNLEWERMSESQKDSVIRQQRSRF